MKRHALIFLAMVFGAVSLAGCAGKEKEANFVPFQDLKAPEWVIKGSGAFGGSKGDVFYGVGSAQGIKILSLLRTAADDRARNEVAKTFEFYTASLTKDYMASTTAGDIVSGTAREANMKATAEEQHVESVIKTVTATTLSGVEIVEHWQNPATGELFSLAKLDLKAFEDLAEKSNELNKDVKNYVRDNAKRLHDELGVEEEKKRAEKKQ
ncbi:MAG: hypothetical protein WA162_04050 [Thermodesulfobacteriota bacterium]